MADPRRGPGFREGTDDTRIPRWVKVLGTVVALVAVLAVALMLMGGGGGHTPRRHGSAEDDTPPVSVTQDAPFGVTGSGGGHSRPPEGALG